MSEEKKKKQEDIKLKKPAEVSAEVSYVQEQAVKNVSDLKVYETEKTTKPEYGISWCRGEKDTEEYQKIEEQVDLVNIYSDEAKFLHLFEFKSMRERLENGESLQQICGDLKSYIIKNKDCNPDAVQRAVACLLDNAEDHYDHGTDNWLGISGYTRKHQGDSSEEILGKILKTPEKEEINGFVCSTIHEFGMRLLDECGIKATMLAGGTGSSNHTCLLWQRSDGKYVHSNYGKSYTLEATNIKDAAREVYKRGLGLINNGYIYFIDNNGSYQEFGMKDEAVNGNEFDKRDYNNQSAFDHSIASAPSVKGEVNVSNLGSFSANITGTLAYGNETVSKETSCSLGFKKSNQTSLADTSTSIGVKIEHKTEKVLDNGKKFSETKIMADYTSLHTDEISIGRDYMQTIDHREFGDEEQIDRIKEWIEKDYENYNKIESYESNVEWCNWYLDYFEQHSQNINSPISKEEFIEQAKQKYVSDDGESYNELGILGQKNALKSIEDEWECYLINNLYNEAKDVIIARRDFNQDHIDNYEQYKNNYVNQELLQMLRIYRGDDDNAVTTSVRSLDTSNISLFFRKVFGREKTLLKDNGIELTNGYKLSGTLGFNDVLTRSRHYHNQNWENGKLISENNSIEQETVFTSFGGDIRLAAEEGLKLDIHNRTSLFSTALSGGITADMSLKSGTLTPTVSPGIKLNGSTSYQTRLNDNVTFGAGISGYSVITKPSVDVGATGHVQASYKPEGSNITIFGGANYGIEQQRIRIGGFNEQTENVRTLGVNVGAQIGNNGSVNLSYNGKVDKLNSTRDRSIISIGAKVNL